MTFRSDRTSRASNVIAAVIGLGVATAIVPRSYAQPAPAPSTAEARVHFQRGLELVDERRYEAALAEFELAYRLRPAYQVLYNLGVVHDALDHTIEAVEAFERYLAEGADHITPARRAEVEGLLAARRRLVARLLVRTNVDGATVSIDGRDVGHLPLAAPIRLTAGAHVLGVRAPGYESQQRALRLAGETEETMTITLAPLPAGAASVVIACAIPAVEILVDGQSVGHTPLAGPLAVAAGRRVIEARRRGYRSVERAVELVASASTTVELSPSIDPSAATSDVGRLRLVLPDDPHDVLVDGASARGSEVALPLGPHDVRVVVRGRRPHAARVDVPAGGEAVLRPRLEWTPEARARELDAASGRRTLGWALTFSGVAVLAVAIPLTIWNETRLDSDLAAMEAECEPMPTSPECERFFREREDDLNDYNAQVGSVDALRYVGIGAAVLGVAGLAVGLERLLGAPSEAQIDRAASARRTPRTGDDPRVGRLRLALGWGWISATSRF